ncbi:cell wall-binding repeat-containing protein [Ornithinicoccus hortensis]|uniref:Putative cell wall binding repeat protein n=1 Tax=Ornithinicoccus hortensis TaxID=82346 RepID=A0A542YNN8_9MICO|nr:cell wall-binding repeat-containing protein [Ornithinicoccus hortensis]TQL49667.1 putative cell wall binding repeat protein [Ornithinicoccus hortensis]
MAAADYVVSQISDDNLGDPGATADGILALLAVDGYDAEVESMTDWLETQAQAYAGAGGPAAGKVALVAAVTGRDATDFGGVDLIAAVEGSIGDDGTCGSWGYAFGQALCILGLDRAGAEVPSAAVTNMFTYQDPETGALGYYAGDDFVPDNEASGLGLAALAAVTEQEGATASAVQVRNYLREAMTEEGYWENFSPVNTTGLVAPALELVGDDIDLSVDWMVGQQLPDGGLPNVLDGESSDLRATVQGMLVFTGESYLSVGEGGEDRVDLVLGPEKVDRVSGPNRYATAAAVSSTTEPGVPVVYVATGREYADALAGSALAGSQDSPVLLVRPGDVPEETATELTRLQPGSIAVLGGTAAVSDDVVTTLGGFTPGDVERISGSTRYGTAAAVASEFDGATEVFVATGRDYADALSAAAYAGAVDAPVLLVRPDEVPDETAAALTELDPDTITVLGGSAAIDDDVVTDLGAFGLVQRVYGTDRYETAAALAQRHEGAESVLLATGQDWPDALTGAARAGQLGEPLLLVQQAQVPPVTGEELVRLAAPELHVLGGSAAVDGAVLTTLEALNYAG